MYSEYTYFQRLQVSLVTRPGLPCTRTGFDNIAIRASIGQKLEAFRLLSFDQYRAIIAPPCVYRIQSDNRAGILTGVDSSKGQDIPEQGAPVSVSVQGKSK